MEVWITVKDFPDYEVSNKGRVRNIKTGKVLLPWDDGKGYKKVELNGHPISIHRIVVLTFFDGRLESLEVNHTRISECLRGIRRTHKGFHFEYVLEV